MVAGSFLNRQTLEVSSDLSLRGGASPLGHNLVDSLLLAGSLGGPLKRPCLILGLS